MIKFGIVMVKRKGFALIAIIIIIIVVGILATATTFFLIESLRYNVIRSYEEKAINLAQAGIYKAIYNYRTTGSYASMEINVVGNEWFSVGADASSYLKVDASDVFLSAGSTRLKNFNITNIHPPPHDITITHMIVAWTPNGGELVNDIRLDHIDKFDSTAASGATIDIIDTIVEAGTSLNKNNDYIEFSADMSGKTSITFTFIFADGSRTGAIQMYPTGNNQFRIKATGKIKENTTVKMRKTLFAAYDVASSEITSWRESNEHIQ